MNSQSLLCSAEVFSIPLSHHHHPNVHISVFVMRTTLSFFAAALTGLAAASPAPHYYGDYGHAFPSGSAPSGGVPTGVIPSGSQAPSGTGHGPYTKPSETSVIPQPSGSGSVYPSGHGPYTHSSGTGVIQHPSSVLPSGHGSYTHPAGTGVVPHPSGTGSGHSTYTEPSGTGVVPHPSGTGVGPHPSGTGVEPSGTGPRGTGSHPEVTPPVSVPPKTITITRDVPSTTTITHVYTSTVVQTITTFVPCSTPIATQDSSTLYSSYLTVSYSTITVTYTSTSYEVVIPRTTPSGSKPTGGSGYGPGYSAVPGASPSNAVGHNQGSGSGNNGGSGNNHGGSGNNHGGSTVTIVPIAGTDAIPSYAPHTSYAPQVGSCPPAEVVYSTVVIEITKTIEAPGSHHQTPCPVCETYTFTLPNGSHISTIISPSAPVATPVKPSHHAPYPVPHGSGKPVYPSGTGAAGTGYIPLPTGTAVYRR